MAGKNHEHSPYLIKLIADRKGTVVSSDRNSYQSSNGNEIVALCVVIVFLAIIWHIFSTLFLSASARIQIDNEQGSPIMVVSKQGSTISRLKAQPRNDLSLMQQVQGWRPWHQPSNLSVAGEDVFLTHMPFVGWSVWTKQQASENHIDASVLSDDTIFLKVVKYPISVPENREIGQPSPGLRDTVHGMKNRIEGLRGLNRSLTP
jgi:hypothetical protein